MKTTKQSGFSLLELMIAVVIAGILSALMFNSYRSHVLKSRRTDAVQTLLSIQLAEERYRSNNIAYGDLTAVWGGNTNAQGGYYTLATSNLGASSYTLTATAIGSQISDAQNGTSCANLSLSMNNGTETKTPTACW